MYWMVTIALLISMAILLIRAKLGPTVLDRVLALNSFGTKTVLLIAVWNFLTGRPEFLDLALIYAMMNFIGTIAVLRFSEATDANLLEGTFDDPDIEFVDPEIEPERSR